jgi:hypothetical protein
MPIALNKVDSYLVEAMEVAERQGPEKLGLERILSNSIKPEIMLPVLVLVRDVEQWRREANYGFEEHAQLGKIISGRVTKSGLSGLAERTNVIAVEASRQAGITESTKSVNFVKARHVHASPIAEEGDGALIAIIDGGIDVCHAAFQNRHGISRIQEIWDQCDTTKIHFQSRSQSGYLVNYGRIHKNQEIDTYVHHPANLPVRLSPPTSGTPDNREHGTHVASIAAGCAVGQFAGGMAPQSGLLIVVPRLQTNSSDPYSIGYSCSHVEALKYIKEYASKARMPVVVNVSMGMNAGAHDGTSLLEIAFDEFSEGGRAFGFSIVKSAGNERGHDGHARLMLGSNSKDVLKWSSKVNERHEDVFEL